MFKICHLSIFRLISYNVCYVIVSVFVVGRSYSSKEKLVENKFPPRLQAILPFRRVRRTNENFKEE